LHVWIVTSERIIDVEQVSLFHREVSEFLAQHFAIYHQLIRGNSITAIAKPLLPTQ